MKMIGLWFLWKCQKLHVLVLSYIVEKANLIIVELLFAAVNAPFQTNRKQQEAQLWTFFWKFYLQNVSINKLPHSFLGIKPNQTW